MKYKLTYDYKGYNCLVSFKTFKDVMQEYKELKNKSIRFNGLILPLYENFKLSRIN